METDPTIVHRRSMNRRHLQGAADRIEIALDDPRIGRKGPRAQFLVETVISIDRVIAAIDAAGDDLAAAAVIRFAHSALLALEGTAVTNDAHLVDALEDLSLPPHHLKWEAINFRDENARMLVAATYEHRESLLRDAIDVPVQGYEVLRAEQGPSGALTCGGLVTLWQNSPICRGGCSVCNGLTLTFAAGGNSKGWYVFGVCRSCGYVSYRAGPMEEILGEIERGLEGSGFPRPTSDQLTSQEPVPGARQVIR